MNANIGHRMVGNSFSPIRSSGLAHRARTASTLHPAQPGSSSTRLDASTSSLLDSIDLGIGLSETSAHGSGNGGVRGGGGDAREMRREARRRRYEEMDEAELVVHEKTPHAHNATLSAKSDNHDSDFTNSRSPTIGHETDRHFPAPTPAVKRKGSLSAKPIAKSIIDDHAQGEDEEHEARDPRRSPASLFGRKRIGMMVLPEGMKRAIREEVAEQPSPLPLRNLYLSSLPHLTSTRRSTPTSNTSSSSNSKSTQTRSKDPVTPLSALLRAVVDLPGEYAAVRNVVEELRVRLGEEEFARLGLGPRRASMGKDSLGRDEGGEEAGGGVVIWDGGMGSGVWSLLGLPMEDDGTGVRQDLQEQEGDGEKSSLQEDFAPEQGPELEEEPNHPIEYVHASRHMLDLSSRLLSTAAPPESSFITYNRCHNPSLPSPPSVVMSTFQISKLPTQRARATRIQEMIDTGAELLIFVEEGTTVGYKAVLEAREHVLHAGGKTQGGTRAGEGGAKRKGKETAYAVAEDNEEAELDEEDDVLEIAGEKYYPVKSQAGKGKEGAGVEAPDQPEDLGYHVIAPCPHDKPCPLAASGSRDICSFSQRVQAPDFLRRTKHSSRGETDFRYTYVVLRKGPRPVASLQVPLGSERGIKQGREGGVALEEKERSKQRGEADERGEIVQVLNSGDRAFEVLKPISAEVSGTTSSPDLDMEELRKEAYGWPRLIVPPIKRSGHVILDSCHPSGSIVRLTVPRSQSKQAFYDARKSSWGDIFPHDTKGTDVIRTRGVRRLKKAEGEVWDETPDDSALENSVEWPVAELVDVEEGEQEDELVRTFG